MVDSLKTNKTFVRMVLLFWVQHLLSEGKFPIYSQLSCSLTQLIGYFVEPKDLVKVARTFVAYRSSLEEAAAEVAASETAGTDSFGDDDDST
jgi:hypothetical protein